MGERINIGSLVLKEQEAVALERSSRSKSVPKFEVVTCSGSDFVVRRTCGKSRKLLVVIVSQRQYYVKDEASGVICPLDDASFNGFMRGAGMIPLDAWWIRELPHGKKSRQEFVKRLEIPGFSTLAESGIWSVDLHSSICLEMGACDISSLAARFKDDSAFVNALRRLCEGRSDTFRQYVASNAPFLLCLMETFGTDIGRRFALEAWNAGFRKLARRDILMELLSIPVDLAFDESTYTGWQRGRCGSPLRSEELGREDGLCVSFSADRFVEYAVHTARSEGFLNEANGFFSKWSQTLKMQIVIDGKVSEKYPRYLLSKHKMLSERMEGLRFERTEAKWRAAVEDSKSLIWEHGNYRIVCPEKTQDLTEEGRALRHCVGSYVWRVIEGDARILFLRDERTPERSLVTVELNKLDGRWTLTQARGERNRLVTNEEKRILMAWCAEKDLAYAC